MSYSSVIAAVTTLLASEVPAVVTVIDAAAKQQGDIPAAQCPAVVLSHHTELDTPFTEESDQRTWWLDVAICEYYPTVGDSINAFDTLQEDIKRMLRANPELSGLGDTAESHVIACGKRQQITSDVWMPTGVGQIVRNMTVSFWVWESVGF